jgi:hypothetical protein
MLYHCCFLLLLQDMPFKKVKINQEGLKLSGAHQHVVSADDVK